VGRRTGLDAVEKKKYLAPAGYRIPAVHPVAVTTELSRLLT
jgi:hypothetical protein